MRDKQVRITVVDPDGQEDRFVGELVVVLGVGGGEGGVATSLYVGGAKWLLPFLVKAMEEQTDSLKQELGSLFLEMLDQPNSRRCGRKPKVEREVEDILKGLKQERSG